MLTTPPMTTENQTRDRVLLCLLKEPYATHTTTSLAEALHRTRQGIWKIISKLKHDKLINIEHIGKAKTSTAMIKLNWECPLTEKTLSLLLTKDALQQQRWRANFAELEKDVEFLILFGSILTTPKDAHDIDILAIVSKKKFKVVEEKVAKVQVTQLKKLHLIDVTKAEFCNELNKQNKAYLDAIKKGVILFGQENFVECIRGL